MTTAGQPTPAQIARAAREAADIIRDPDRWLTKGWGLLPNGQKLTGYREDIPHCNPDGPFCAEGAYLYRLHKITGLPPTFSWNQLLDQAAEALYPRKPYIHLVNDTQGREASIRVLERAAELAEQQAQA